MIRFCTLAAVAFAAIAPLAASAQTNPIPDSAFSSLKWREIGPYRGGRSVAVAGSRSRPNE